MRTLSQTVHLCFLYVLSTTFASAQTPRIVVNSLGHSAKIHKVLFTPNGHQIISVSEDKTIRIWSAETGDMIKKFESQIGDGPEGMFYAAALSPDGKLLAVAGYQVAAEQENYIIIIDLEKGIQVSAGIGHSDVINTLSFSGSGKFLASGGADQVVKIWKVESAPKLSVIASIPIPSPVSCVAFNHATQDLAVVHESNDILVYGLAGLDKAMTKFTPRVLRSTKVPWIKSFMHRMVLTWRAAVTKMS
jgi:WD40 repeat protein